MNTAILEIDKILSGADKRKNDALTEIDSILKNRLSNEDAISEIDKILSERNKRGGFWQSLKGFGSDLAKVPSEVARGAESVTDQMRMFGNFLQGDADELESLYRKQSSHKPLPEAETTVGGWVRGAANTLPYMGLSAAAGVGGGAAGSAVAPGVGTTIGAGLGSASVGFAQGWGEMYGRLRNEGIDHDTAAGIALAAAPAYAGIEAFQVRKIPGAAQLADRYLGAPFKRMLASKLADKAFKNKVARALGSYAGEIISQSAEEGAQEMILNAGEQYGRNGGFQNFDLAENTGAGAEAFKESAGPFAVIQAGNMPLSMLRTRRARDIANVRGAVEEGRKFQEIPLGIKPGEMFKGVDGKIYRNVDGTARPIAEKEAKTAEEGRNVENSNKRNSGAPAGGGMEIGGLSNLEADASVDEIDLQNAAQNNLDRVEGKKGAPAQPGFDREQAAALFIQNLRNDPYNVSQGISPNEGSALGEFLRTRARFAEEEARKIQEKENKAQKEALLDRLAEEDEANRQFEEAKKRTDKKISELAPKKSRIASRIDKIEDPDMRLDAIEFEYEQGNIGKLTTEQLEDAMAGGYEWAERELGKRLEAENSGSPLLQVMKENGFKLPTPAAVRRHAAASGRGLGSYLYGEINDLYNSLPASLRLRYFSKNYVNLDETAESLKQFGFKYDGEGEFISDVADNLSGQKISYGFSLAENGDFSKMPDSELVEAHRKAFDANDGEAGRKIAHEWLRRKGYGTEAYHGTGADGFNVADATSKYEANGEGAQAHGPGLYMAADRDTAIGYRKRSSGKADRNTLSNLRLKGKPLSGFINWEILVDRNQELLNIMFKEMAESPHRFSFKEYIENEDDWIKSTGNDYDRAVHNQAKKTIESIERLFAEKNIKTEDISIKKPEGRIFDWLHNMKPDEMFDEENPNSVVESPVGKKYQKAWVEDILPILRREYGFDEAELDDVKRRLRSLNSAKTILRNANAILGGDRFREIMLKHGIRGITYNGRQDGRAFVSFEGGPAVKLQDPFTFDDNGNYIPLDRRGDLGNPDMRYSIEEKDALRFKADIEDYKNGKRNFTMVLGTTPEVLKRCGAPDSNIELTDKTLTRKLAQHPELNIDALKELPAEIADPIAVFQSQQIPNAVVVLTEIQTENGNVIAAIHFDIRNKKGFLVNDIRSIHGRPDRQIVNFVKNGMTRYVNTKRAPYWLKSPLVQFHGRDLNNKVLYGDKIQTESDLSQAERENIFRLRRVKSKMTESEVPFASQSEISKIKSKIESIQKDFNRRAKARPDVSVAETIKEAREKLGAENLPYNARAVQTGDKIVIIAENINDADEAARIFLHEQVGHWGLRGLLGADLKPFLNYVINKYKDSDAWNRIKRNYGGAGDYTIAEEVLAHAAENRELSDPSFWKRFVHRIKRALWGNGVPQEYVNLLDEDVLRSAIALGRDWAKGDRYLNANGIWERLENIRKGRDVPDDEKQGNFSTKENPDIRYSVAEDDAQRFEAELQDYIDGNLDNRHVFKLGTTPEVMRLVGADDLPLELAASVLATKEAKHNLNIESLKKLPAELSDPIAIFQSAQIPNGLLVITEIPDINGKKIAVAVHLDKTRNRNRINDIRSIHGRSDFNMQTQVDMGLLRYINTKRRPHSLRLNRVAPVSGSVNKAFNVGRIFTESDLSQAEKDNIFRLRGENASFRYSIKEEKPETYDGRFGNANRKYTRLLGRKKRELGRNISYDELPNVAADEEFEKEVGMSKDAFASLMKERDKMGADMAHEYQKTAQRTKQATVDRFNPIKIVEMFLNGGEAFGAEKSAYKSLLAAGNMNAVMYNAIYVGLPMFNRKKGQWEIRKGTKPLIAYFDNVKGDKYENFENYAKAVAMLEHYKRAHNLETISDAYKWADGKEFEAMAGFTKQQAKQWMQEAASESKKTVKSLQEFFAANREFMVETGLASRKQAEVLNSFEYYFPMLRDFEENDSIMSGDGGGYRSGGFSGRSSGVKSFTGSKRKTRNVMESIIERTAALYANGYKNIAMQRSIQMLSEFGLAKHAGKTSETVKARISCAKDALEKAGVRVGDIKDDSELIPLEAFHITDSLDERIRDNIVSVRSNGRLIFYKINDPELLVALKSLGQEQMNVLTTWLIGAKNVMTWGVTKLPAFAIRNFLRDTGANAVLLGNNPAKSAANFAKALKDTPQMRNIRMSGFGGAVWYPVSAKGVSADFGNGTRKKTARAWKYAITPFRAYDRVLQASEQANRITAYDRAIADGVSEAEAAFRANDVLPFNMRGSGVWTGKNIHVKSGIQILSWLIRVSPFVNAGIQGLFKAYRELGVERGMFNAKDEFSKRARIREVAKSLNKALMARGAMLAALSVAYSIYANSSTDDDGEKWYEKLPDDDKLNYWHFYAGNNTILRIPKPFEIGYLFSTIPTALTDAFLSENPDTANILYKGLIDQMRFDLTSNPAINAFKENLRNKTSFTGSPVVERSDLNLPPQMQYGADTSATAKALSIIPSMLPWLKDSWAASPARIQNALNNFFGGMSQYGTYVSDAVLQSFTDIEQPTSRYARISPVTRAYDWATRDTKTMRVKNSEVFYELKGRVDELYAAARMYRQTGQLERLGALMENHKAELGNYELINAVNTRLREIATKRRKLGETKTYSSEEMIELDDKLLAERNRVLANVDKLLERIENGEYRIRDLREIKQRIERSARDRNESQKAKKLIRQLE